MRRSTLTLPALVGLVVLLAGCGSKSTSPATNSASNSTSATKTQPAKNSNNQPGSASALRAEAVSAAAGDIPDNQVFLNFRASGWTMKYPEGWAQSGSEASLFFRDKSNIVRVIIIKHAAPTVASIQRELASLKTARIQSAPTKLALKGSQSAFKVVYTTKSAPNPVTGKSVTLIADRYYLWHGGKEAIVDLGTPQGVDNVDAYRLMIESFRWR
jgi:FlaG/FlaF family flagellin (archaellin)